RRYGFNVIFTISKKLDCVIKRGKDLLNNARKSDVVYRIDCGDCESCYIGQTTKRHLKTRIREHMSDIKKHCDNQSVVSKHRLCEGHEFDWSNVKVVHQEMHTKKREIAEIIHIKKQDNTINVQKDTENLPTMYHEILKNTWELFCPDRSNFLANRF
ncbi:hypothetical protein X777_15529, partial [Ooceraea biroi]